jgi:cardiolipin synthase
MRTPKEFFKDMAAAGVEIVEFNPVAANTVLSSGLAALNHRDHRKVLIADGRVGFLGGINISSVYSSSPSSGGGSGSISGSGAVRGSASDLPPDQRPWRDTQASLEGPAVADLQHAFLEQWAKQRKEDVIEDRAYYPTLAAAGTQLVRVIDGSAGGQEPNPMYIAFISAIDNAETEVRLMNPYFVPHEELRRALKDAARRGVDVKLILPSRIDSRLVFHAGRSYYDDLLEAGVKIYERKDRILHSKTASVDGVWATVGSTNLDWRSLLYNDEINAVVLGTDFAAQMNAHFARDLAQSVPITLEDWRKRPLTDRLKEAAARAWSRLL